MAEDDPSTANAATIFATYIETPGDGELSWSPRKRQERIFGIIGLGQLSNYTVEWRTNVDLNDCDSNHPCTCMSFEAYEISAEGYLVEIEKSVQLLNYCVLYRLSIT